MSMGDLASRGEPDGSVDMETEVFNGGSIGRRSMMVNQQQQQPPQNNGGYFYAANTTTTTTGMYFQQQSGSSRPYSHYDTGKKFHTLNEALLRRKRSCDDSSPGMATATLPPTHIGVGYNRSAPNYPHQYMPQPHATGVMQLGHPSSQPQLYGAHHGNINFVNHSSQPSIYMQSHSSLHQPPPQVSPLGGSYIPGMVPPHHNPNVPHPSNMVPHPSNMIVAQPATISPTPASTNKIKRIKKSGFLGLRVYGRFNKNSKMKAVSTVETSHTSSNPSISQSVDQCLDKHERANSDMCQKSSPEKLGSLPSNVGRSNSLDFLNFEQKRKLIASSLSKNADGLPPPPPYLGPNTATLGGSRAGSPVPEQPNTPDAAPSTANNATITLQGLIFFSFLSL